jgi:hypothetical protein
MIFRVRSTAETVIATTILLLVLASLPWRALAQGNVSETSNVAGWSVVAVGDDASVICTIGRMNRQKLVLNVVAPSKHRVLAFMLDGSEIGWRLKPGSEYDVAFVIDDSPPVAAKARAETETAIAIPFALDFSATEPLRRGRTIEFRAARGTFWFNLAGSAKALDALSACVRRYGGVGDTSANPFEGAAPEASSTLKRQDESVTTSSADAGVEREVDAAIATAKELRMVRVIFANDTAAETELREQLRFALTNTPAGGKRSAVSQIVVQAFLAGRVEKALKVAPPDALARMVRHDRDVLQQLFLYPEICAAYFKANGTGDFSYLPTKMRQAQGEIYADVIEAAMLRPSRAGNVPSDQQVATWMAGAYAKLGYPTEDLNKLAEVGTLGDREVCRLANQFMSALSTLDDTQASQLYRLSSP